MKILVYIQQDQGTISSVSLEALKGAQDIAEETGGTVTVITFNSETGNSLSKYDIAETLVINNEFLDIYSPLYYIRAMEQIVSSTSPDIIVFGHTYEARDWVARLSARLDIPFISVYDVDSF